MADSSFYAWAASQPLFVQVALGVVLAVVVLALLGVVFGVVRQSLMGLGDLTSDFKRKETATPLSPSEIKFAKGLFYAFVACASILILVAYFYG
jgi:hypothetical protein